MHVSPAKHSYGSVTDRRWTKGSLYVAIIRRRHNNTCTKTDTQIYVSFNSVSAARAPRGTDRSPEYNEHFCHKLDSRVKNLTTEWNQKQRHFITHASRLLLWIRFVAVAFRSEEKAFWRRGPPMTYFASPLIRPWANMAKTSLCMCRAMSTSSLPSFENIHNAVL